MSMRILALTEGLHVPSARFRVRQLIPSLRREGIELTEHYSRAGKYPPRTSWERPIWAFKILGEQITRVRESYRFDAVLLQRELVSTLTTLEPFTKKPRILDVDDAIFVHRGGHFARRLAGMCERVVCGNSFLAEWFAKFNPNVITIPTAVDTERFCPNRESTRSKGVAVVVWIGTGVNLRYLLSIEPALSKMLTLYPQVRLRVVCDEAPCFRGIDPERIEFIRWSEGAEVGGIQSADVGIMPLEDSLWARGKCSYKLLQYMACGLPVVVSPVGMNIDVLRMGDVGLTASSQQQWLDALVSLLHDRERAAALGARGRRLVEDRFSIDTVAPLLASVLRGGDTY